MQRKCKFFKSKVHYLGFLVGINGVQPQPEKVTAIEALEQPKDINKLRHFLGLACFTENSFLSLLMLHHVSNYVKGGSDFPVDEALQQCI